MKSEKSEKKTDVTDISETSGEIAAAPKKKSLIPWLIAVGGFLLIAVGIGIISGMQTPLDKRDHTPLDKRDHTPTIEELEQIKYDSEQKEKERQKAESLRDQNLLLRTDDDSKAGLNTLLKDLNKKEPPVPEKDIPSYDANPDDTKAEEEAISHVLLAPPPAVVPTADSYAPPQTAVPASGGNLSPMFVYSRKFGGAKYVEPAPKAASYVAPDATSPAKASTAKIETVKPADAAPEPEKQTRIIYNNLPSVTLYEGEMIEAVLVNRLIVDTEAAPVICHTSRDLFDSSGKYVVIPANSRVIGSSQAVSYKGASRLFITFSRIILPGGQSIDLPASQKAMKALDETGALGIVSKVDRHWFLQFGTSIFFGVLDGLSGMAQRNQEDSARSAVLGRTSENFDRVMDNIMSQYSSIVPTIRVDQGKTLRLYLADDIEISPYAKISDRSYYATR